MDQDGWSECQGEEEDYHGVIKSGGGCIGKRETPKIQSGHLRPYKINKCLDS